VTDKKEDPFDRVGKAVAGGEANGVRPPPYDGEQVAPVPDGSPEPMRRHKQHGDATHVWTYRDSAGRVLFIVARFSQADGGKVVLPQTLRRIDGRLKWAWKAPADPRQLYGLAELAARASAPVLVVEGEKAADAAAKRFPSHVVVTWQGGSKATGKADWSPLTGREVTLWPDADEPGSKAAADIAGRLSALGVRAATVQLPAGLPAGWDLADEWPAGFGPADAAAALNAACAPEREVYWPKGFHADATGVWWAPKDNGKGEEAAPIWLCGAVDVIASARDEEGGDWSTVVEFRDPDGKRKREIIGKGELAGDGVDVRRRLMAAGLPVSSNKAARERLQAGLAAVTCSERARLASSTGWRGPLYVLPHRTFGSGAREPVIYRGRAGGTHHGEAGSYEAWRELVAAKASGNALLLFALSCAFAAPLMRLLGGEGGGFHARGESSSGKTTLLRAAGSVWGGGGELGFAQSWRNTDNALEAVALAHNDGLLALDELRQLDPTAAGAAAYALAAGVAKGRLRADAELKARPTWRVLILSAGEIGLADMIRLAKGKDKSYAGQELRLIDLDADMGQGLGAWQTLHHDESPAAFSEALKTATDAHYGQAGPLFVERFMARQGELEAVARRLQSSFLDRVAEPGDTGQARRGAQRFALAAVAGELAALLDVTPWQAGEAAAATATIFRRWAGQFGRSTQREDREAIQKLKAFIERYEHSRFRLLKDGLSDEEQLADQVQQQRDAEAGKFRGGEARSLDAAGYKGVREGHGEIFYFNPEFWKGELFAGMDGIKAAKALRTAGYLINNTGDQKRLTLKVKVHGVPRNFYAISHKILSADLDSEDA
jgi:uncharacterized protein (DUF927 family)